MSLKNPVKPLSPEVARKIAAGEVIDRPNAIIRELMDNAIDSGADRITVEIQGGGIEKIRVIDNGSGMTKEDLENCARPHATSKISSENDLLKLSTLGFRGEALSSIAAVSRLSIISGGYKMRSSITEDHIIERTSETAGTIVQSEGLFENIPARRIFLKRPATESTMCRNTFIEKSLPCPEKSFRFSADGEVKLDFPAGQTLCQRFVGATELREDISLFNEINFQNHKDFSFQIVIGEPSVYRTSKKDISVFVNGRKIQEYSLVQAIEYGAQGYFPNGTFPVAAIFIKILPELVDFNIHPAKKEVRFKDIASLHHEVSTSVRRFFQEYTNKKINKFNSTETETSKPRQNELFKPAHEDLRSVSKVNEPENSYAAEKNASSSYEKFKEKFLNQHPEYVVTHTVSYSDKTKETLENSNNSAPEEKKSSVPEHSDESAVKVFSCHNTDSKENVQKSENYEKKPEKTEEFSDSLHNKTVTSFLDLVLKNYTQSYTKPVKINSSEKSVEAETSVQASEPAISGRITETSSSEKSEIEEFSEKPRFVGSVLGTFLIVEWKDALYIIDKHAAHERILFNKIMTGQGKSQNLLIPETFETQTQEDDLYLEKIAPEMSKIGFEIQKLSSGKWQLLSINERWTGTSEELFHEILEKKVQPSEIIYSIAATTACKSAVKDGYILDDSTAASLAEETLKLPDPHCPHGRPVYTVISRAQLFEAVRRT